MAIWYENHRLRIYFGDDRAWRENKMLAFYEKMIDLFKNVILYTIGRMYTVMLIYVPGV